MMKDGSEPMKNGPLFQAPMPATLLLTRIFTSTQRKLTGNTKTENQELKNEHTAAKYYFFHIGVYRNGVGIAEYIPVCKMVYRSRIWTNRVFSGLWHPYALLFKPWDHLLRFKILSVLQG